MQTPARKRAEALFAECTKPGELAPATAKPGELAPETAKPAQDRTLARANGPKTLHLPSDARPAQADGQITKP